MARNFVLLATQRGPLPWAARLASRGGGEIGLVLTAIELGREKLSGGRIEEERDYAGAKASTLDEPVFIGSAIAQLAGHCDVVIVDGLEQWVQRVLERFPDDPIERDAEILSLVSVLQARMADLVLVARKETLAAGPARLLLERALESLAKHADSIVELAGETARALQGPLPA